MTPDIALTLVVFAGAAVAFCAIAGIAAGVGADEHAAYRRRLRRVRGATAAPGGSDTSGRRWHRRRPASATGSAPDLRIRLARFGLTIPPALYRLISSLIGAGAAMAAHSVFDVIMLSAAAAVGAALFVPRLGLAVLASRRETRFLKQFPDALDLIIRGVKSGYPVAEAIGVIADELPDPIGTEFRFIQERLRLGQSLDAALTEAGERIALQDFRFFAVSLAVQAETGGNIAETLQNLSDLLRRRQNMKLKVKALSSEARASAWVLGLLPAVVMIGMHILNPAYLSGLLDDPTGRVLLGIALVSELTGVLVMVKMTRFRI